jgi:hypothetical protein
MTDVFVLQHVHEFEDGRESMQFVGVYSTATLATEAIERLSLQSGFRETPGGFHIDTYRLDEDNWTEGYKTVPDP